MTNASVFLPLAVLLSGCASRVPPPAPADPQVLICAHPATEEIADADPALSLFEGDLESRKVALAIERVNGCDS
jgi:hypothetical protein